MQSTDQHTQNVKSRVMMYGLPNRIVSRISLRIFQPLKCNFIFKTQIFYLLCSLTVADGISRWQPVQK